MLMACTQTEKEKANEYYDRFSKIVIPFKNESERLLTECQSLLQKQFKASGNFKLSREDSIKQMELLTEFQAVSRKTMDDLNAFDDFPGSDLKTAALEYVRSTSTAVSEAYKVVVIPMQTLRPPDQHTIDSLSEKFSDRLMESNEKFASSQMQFLHDFELLAR